MYTANVRFDRHTLGQLWTPVHEVMFASQQNYIHEISPTKHSAVSRCFIDSGMLIDYYKQTGKGKKGKHQWTKSKEDFFL